MISEEECCFLGLKIKQQHMTEKVIKSKEDKNYRETTFGSSADLKVCVAAQNEGIFFVFGFWQQIIFSSSASVFVVGSANLASNYCKKSLKKKWNQQQRQQQKFPPKIHFYDFFPFSSVISSHLQNHKKRLPKLPFLKQDCQKAFQ